MAERLRIGLIGAGRRGTAHFATISCLPDLYELVAICDPKEASAHALAERAEGAAVYAEVKECFARARLDAVVIATPPETHHLAAKAAADHRVHMLIETPLAPTRAMMDLIGEAAEKAGVQVEVGENYGRRPAERLNQAALRAGLIGKIVHLSAFNAPANHESCYHTMSLFLAYAGQDIVEVRATAHQRELDPDVMGGGPDAETWVDAVLTFADGITASLGYVTSWTTPVRWARPRIATVEGTAGYILSADGGENRLHRLERGVARDYPIQVETRASVEDANSSPRSDPRPRAGGELPAPEIPTRYHYGTTPAVEVRNPLADRVMADADAVGVADGLARADELLSLHRAVTDGTAPEYGITQARRSQELGIAIAEAGRLGCPLDTHLRDETTWERDQHATLQQRWGAHPLKDVDLILKGG